MELGRIGAKSRGKRMERAGGSKRMEKWRKSGGKVWKKLREISGKVVENSQEFVIPHFLHADGVQDNGGGDFDEEKREREAVRFQLSCRWYLIVYN